MSTNRIQKLLFSDYCDFEDMVLVESPFAETSREGLGLRQVNLGLTPSKLVVATDILPNANSSSVLFEPGIDPDIETLELVAVYPVDCVNLSVFHRRKRQSLKARFCNNKVLYFELGGFENRQMFWNLWCEKIKFLSPDDTSFSHSETSVATSSTNSTLYLVSSKRCIQSGRSQIWHQYAAGDCYNNLPPKWPDKHLYLGKVFEDSPMKYTPLQMPPTEAEFVKSKESIRTTITDGSQYSFSTQCQQYEKQTTVVNRFSCSVKDNCRTGLYLPIERNSNSHISNQSQPSELLKDVTSVEDFTPNFDVQCVQAMIHNQPFNFKEVANSAVRLWELYPAESSSTFIRARHRRRYAFSPLPHFYRGLGPWNVNQGERFTLQMKRAVSLVNIRRQPLEPELRLSVSRRQLVASISCENLASDNYLNSNSHMMRNAHKTPLILFWTPEYWYRPQHASEAYHDLQLHLNQIRQYQQLKEKIQGNTLRKHYKKQRLANNLESDCTSVSSTYFKKVKKSRKHSIMHRSTPTSKKLASANQTPRKTFDNSTRERSLQILKRALRMDLPLCAWDFDSHTLAMQLTLIDKTLFLNIISEELSVLLWQQSSRNAPNISALIAFSHRIGSLIATEILKDDSIKLRARLIARFINVADKCHKFNNYQSCRSVLCGLQAPPIFRLHSTWNYVRKRHSSRYEIFENLCHIYRDPRLPTFQKAFASVCKQEMYMPFIGDLISKLLDIIPITDNSKTSIPTTTSSDLSTNVNSKPSDSTTNHSMTDESSRNLSQFLKKIISSLRMWHADKKSSEQQQKSVFTAPTNETSNISSFQTVVDKCKQLYYYEDNRQARLKECVELLEVYQQAIRGYDFPTNELANEYLIKARYQEDKNNFVKSLKVELPLINYEK